MKNWRVRDVICGASLIILRSIASFGQDSVAQQNSTNSKDAVEQAQKPQDVLASRVEQQKHTHDRSDRFKSAKASPLTQSLETQPGGGDVTGFDFYRDALNAPRPQMTFHEIRDADIREREKVMQAQAKLLGQRYVLEPKFDAKVTMTRGKPLCVGPTARLAENMTWDKLASMSSKDTRDGTVFPDTSLPHPKHATGGQVFPKMQLEMF